ncbi:hypothetical protein Harman_26990 [Haloarcula mannanilytica]|uniref:DUF8048 domain-containing protein n=1 Tax=Haloarcula mannanilytica TaxID=2509225 RepID=A0A4C2EJT1_9EURY|nr:hypothetical protein [Haloarcula mannanilytica]GCF14764.1 hypothetical protein Harman_26990 [Haloarcula mannanilytica]
MAKADTGTASTESGLDTAVIERAAERAGIDEKSLCDALVILHADLIGRHSKFEREFDYVTVDGTRAYRISDEVCDDLLSEFGFDDDIAAGVRLAHTEQAKLLFAKSVRGDDNFDADECGIVIGIDTAEQF